VNRMGAIETLVFDTLCWSFDQYILFLAWGVDHVLQ